jgi:hypothetical protein
MSPVERAARAIQSAWDDGSDVASGLPPIEFTEAEALHLARAVLQAIGEPSDDQLIAAQRAMFAATRSTPPSHSIRTGFVAMIDAALSE